LKTLRLQLRFLVPLLAALVVAATLAVPLLDQVTLRWFSRDLNSRGVVVANALSDSVSQALMSGQVGRLQKLLDRAAQDERMFAVGLCSPDGRLLQATDRYPSTLNCAAATVLAGEAEPHLALPGGAVHVGVHDIMGQRPSPPPPAPVPLLNPAPEVLPEDAVATLPRRRRRRRSLLLRSWWATSCSCTTSASSSGAARTRGATSSGSSLRLAR